jgi:hypothetical protein
MDALAELAVKIALALVIIWMFSRMTFIMYWVVQPFIAGFVAGILVTLLFIIKLRRY